MKLDLKTVPKLKPHPVFKGLKQSLKDPKCYKEIESKLQRTVYSDHKHKSVSEYVKCKWCSVKYQKRKQLMKDFGFKSDEQYLEWRRIMSIIISQQNIQLR